MRNVGSLSELQIHVKDAAGISGAVSCFAYSTIFHSFSDHCHNDFFLTEGCPLAFFVFDFIDNLEDPTLPAMLAEMRIDLVRAVIDSVVIQK